MKFIIKICLHLISTMLMCMILIQYSNQPMLTESIQPKRTTHLKGVSQDFCPSVIGVFRNAHKELFSSKEDITSF